MSNVPRECIKPNIIRVLSAVSGWDESDIEEKHSLSNDLRISTSLKGGLALSYTMIAKKCAEKHNFDNPKKILQTEARKLSKVKDAIDLTHKRSNGKD